MKNHDRFFGTVTVKDGSEKKKKYWIRSPFSLCRASKQTGPELWVALVEAVVWPGEREGRSSVAQTAHSTGPTSRSAHSSGAACPAVHLGGSLCAEGIPTAAEVSRSTGYGSHH